uniref:Bestrophin homolog n=1 Tax=Panagrolaimus davidi TaxID=227884 RepID=A0A914PTY3_9BILA
MFSTAVALTTYIRGSDEETRIMRCRIIRYLVLSQIYVLRNVSIQVRERFPTFEATEDANLINSEEKQLLEETKDNYSQFWIPIIWAEEILYEARQQGKISIYMGWLKVAEDMLHPLGEEFDNLECNYIIDKNLITGLSLVDKGGKQIPSPQKDEFWDKQNTLKRNI